MWRVISCSFFHFWKGDGIFTECCLSKNFSPILLLLLPELLIAKQHPLLQGGPERCLEWRKKEENKLPVYERPKANYQHISLLPLVSTVLIDPLSLPSGCGTRLGGGSSGEAGNLTTAGRLRQDRMLNVQHMLRDLVNK